MVLVLVVVMVGAISEDIMSETVRGVVWFDFMLNVRDDGPFSVVRCGPGLVDRDGVAIPRCRALSYPVPASELCRPLYLGLVDRKKGRASHAH
jgi:hypothetical protein